MSDLVFETVADGPLLAANARFHPGVSVVLGADATALATLVAVGAGARLPRRGRVLVDGALLYASPSLRRSTAALLADESLPALGTVTDALAALLAARADRRGAREFLEEVGLAGWGSRRAWDLDASERRTLLGTFALAHQNPRLVMLYEPLAAGLGLNADFVRSGLARATSAGAVVLVATQSLDDARSLGGAPWLLHRGVLANAPNAPLGSIGEEQAFVVETPDARRLTAALARDPLVRGVRWNDEHSPSTVLVFGGDTERLASAIARALAEESASARSIRLLPASLEALLAPRAALGPPQYPYGAPTPPLGPAPNLALGAPPAPTPTAPAPPDQSVTMPTAFADPTRPPGGGGS